jgi:hypothetical protein
LGRKLILIDQVKPYQQFAVRLLLFCAMRATKALAVGMFWVAFAMLTRKPRWPVFFAVLAVMVGVFGFLLKA